MVGPTADELSAETVAELEALADMARAEIERDLRERPGAGQGLDQAAEDALDALRDGYMAAGLDRTRADRAMTTWMILKYSTVVDALAQSDAGTWREAGDAPGGLGQR